MKEFRINDKWVLVRVSSQGTSFSDWISDLMKTVEQSLEDLPPEQLAELKKNKDFSSIKDLDKQMARAQKDLAQIGNKGGMLSKMGSKMANSIMRSVRRELEESQSELDELDLDISIITGQRKSLSSALYDVSKDRGIESKGLLYLIKA